MADAVTKSPFTDPFETALMRLGVGGLDLKQAQYSKDTLQQSFIRMTNAYHTADGALRTRPGQTRVATVGTRHHKSLRLNNPLAASWTRLWSVDGSIYIGQSDAAGGLALVESGFSGNRLTMIPHRPTLSGDVWGFIADSAKMRKVRSDGLSLEIGLPAPNVPVTAEGSEHTTSILAFDASDGSDAASWTPNAGTDVDGNASGVPSMGDLPGKDGNCVAFYPNPGALTKGYFTFWGKGVTRDLSKLDAGAVDASDDDVIHFWMRMGLPSEMDEIRIYFVCSAVFDPTVLPGTSATANQDAYYKTIRSNDFADFIEGFSSQVVDADAARINEIVNAYLQEQSIEQPPEDSTAIQDKRRSWADLRAVVDAARKTSLVSNAGVDQWLEFGVVGLPVRRGDFARLGVTTGRDWSTITGVVVLVKTNTNSDFHASLSFDDMYMTGGAGPDSADPGAASYDYRVTNYDPRTGAESNPSDVQDEDDWLDVVRREIDITPAAYGDVEIRQRVYRRGGVLTSDWYFVGENTSDGGVLTDDLTDEAASASGTVATNHYQPVPTQDKDGNTVLAQPVTNIWGPVEGTLFACGDPYRPGHLYASLVDQPDHWSPERVVEVCSPSEELMAGERYAEQSFVFSRERLYSVVQNWGGDGSIRAVPTACNFGLASRYALAVGTGGIYFASRNGRGIYVTQGGEPRLLSDKLRPWFEGQAVEGLPALDWTKESEMDMTIIGTDLYFLFQDTAGTNNLLVYSIIYDHWFFYDFAYAPTGISEDVHDTTGEAILMIGSLITTGASYYHKGERDHDQDIFVDVILGYTDLGRPRENKLFGDVHLDCNPSDAEITVAISLDDGNVANTSQIAGGLGFNTRDRYILDSFGTEPQMGRSVSARITWSRTVNRNPILYNIGLSFTPQPETTMDRVTNWDDAGSATEKYLIGAILECNTFGENLVLNVEYELGGVVYTASQVTIHADRRRKVFLSWPVVKANLIRLRPQHEVCDPWILYRLDWLQQPEPARISGWDTNWENKGDSYYTGLDIECDTFGVAKTVEIYADQTLISTQTVTANGRRLVHLTLGPGRAHIYRFVSTDANPGLLYSWNWHLEQEPSEQTNWNQNYTVAGTLTDKYLKAIILECDTFNIAKSVQVQVDGVTVETLSVTQSGRGVQHLALASQARGRLFRILPTDNNPGRLYNVQWVFDEEPLGQTHWETQEVTHGIPGWHFLLFSNITLRSSAQVTLTVTVYGQDSTTPLATDVYIITSTGGIKRKVYLKMNARKGALYKYDFVSASPFWLYREESDVIVQPWNGGEPVVARPFGSSDLDLVRSMPPTSSTGRS